jgi:hypothetical protein
MPSELQNNGNLNIVTNSFPELLTEVEAAIHKGFVFDIESNAGYPQMIGTLFTVVMFPEGDVEVQEIENGVQVDSTGKFVGTEERFDGATPEAVAPKLDGRRKKV